AAWGGQPDPVEDRRGRADPGQPVQALDRVHQGTHRLDAAPAVHAAQRVAVEAVAGARAQLSLDIVGEVLLRPLMVVTATGYAHHFFPRGSGLDCRSHGSRSSLSRS